MHDKRGTQRKDNEKKEEEECVDDHVEEEYTALPCFASFPY